MRVKALILALSFMLCMCACTMQQNNAYESQSNIKMNYNNISTHSRYWLTNERLCYLSGNLFDLFYYVEGTKKVLLSPSRVGFGIIQDYGNKIYMLIEENEIDEQNANYEIKVYDVNSKKLNTLCKLKNCENYFVLDDVIYYLQYEWINDQYTLFLKKAALNDTATIADCVVSFGVIENQLFYIKENDDRYTVFEYNIKTNASTKRGEFRLPDFAFASVAVSCVSYTKNCILIAANDDEDNGHIFNYSLDNDSVEETIVDGYIAGFNSYNANSYFSIEDYGKEGKIFKFDNATNKALKIGELPGVTIGGSIFVGSDDGFYILANDLYYCSNNGDLTLIYKF